MSGPYAGAVSVVTMHAAQVLLARHAYWQSVFTRQVSPGPHLPQWPPQSMPVSSLFLMPSLQVGAQGQGGARAVTAPLLRDVEHECAQADARRAERTSGDGIGREVEPVEPDHAVIRKDRHRLARRIRQGLLEVERRVADVVALSGRDLQRAHFGGQCRCHRVHADHGGGGIHPRW